jgi:hypothetical protein
MGPRRSFTVCVPAHLAQRDSVDVVVISGGLCRAAELLTVLNLAGGAWHSGAPRRQALWRNEPLQFVLPLMSGLNASAVLELESAEAFTRADARLPLPLCD